MPPRSTAWLLLAPLLLGCSRKPPYEGKSVAELERMLDDPSPTVQAQGAFGLGLHGAEARLAIPALTRTLKSSDTLVRQQSAVALGKIGTDAEEAVPALIEALRDPEWSIRRQAAVALGRIGPPARAAEPELRRCQHDKSTLVRKAAAEALGKISNKAASVSERVGLAPALGPCAGVEVASDGWLHAPRNLFLLGAVCRKVCRVKG